MKGKIFSPQEVQAILAGNKTMFREVIKPQPNSQQKHTHKITFSQKEKDIGKVFLSNQFIFGKGFEEKIECPYQVGQKIFCKESFLQKICATQLPSGEHETFFYGSEVEYIADGAQERWDNPNVCYPNWWKKRPGQHMKQEHSRITLIIKEIRVEKLGDISEKDAIKEGATSRPKCFGYNGECDGFSMDWSRVGQVSKWALNKKTLTESDICMGSATHAFGSNWNTTHKNPEHKFEASPWVWVVEFKKFN